MITGFILTILSNIIYQIASWLPTGSLPSDMTTGISSLMVYYWKFNSFLPLTETFQVMLFIIGLEIVIFSFDGVMFFVNLIRGRK